MVVRKKHGDIAILRTMGTTLGTRRRIVLVARVESMLGMQFLSSRIYPVNYLPTEIRGNDVALVAALACR